MTDQQLIDTYAKDMALVREWVPTCPTCRASMRRRDGKLVCDLHGAAQPVYVQVEADDNEEA